jgi:nitric oxide reductase large subunit
MGKDMPKGVKEMNTLQATNLVDTILNGEYGSYKRLAEAADITDFFLDELENKLDNVPDQDINQLSKKVSDELSQDQSAPMEEMIAMSVTRLISEESYRDYFKMMMKKYNISDIGDLSDEKKKVFFNAVDKGWKAKNEK